MRSRAQSQVSTSGKVVAVAAQEAAVRAAEEESESESDLGANSANEFQFGIWLRHRRIDGALNRVPPDFYATLWDTVRLFPHGLSINNTILHRSLTQEVIFVM